jgi:hypothetical protein
LAAGLTRPARVVADGALLIALEVPTLPDEYAHATSGRCDQVAEVGSERAGRRGRRAEYVADMPARARDAALLHGLAERVEHERRELRELVEEQGTGVRNRTDT